MPMVNLGWRVLWRTVYMPIRLPRLPPKAATPIKVASGIRQSFFFALYLSISIRAKPSALISSRYARMTGCMTINPFGRGFMKKLWFFGLLLVFLAGCSVSEMPEPETVSDEWTLSAMAEPKTVRVKLPGETEVGAVDAAEGRLYMAEDYEITIEMLDSGDLDGTLRQVCGFSRDELTVMETNPDGLDRYDFVWACAGENGEQLGRGVILDDGSYHYVMTVLRDVDSKQNIQIVWSEVFDSFTAV